MPIDYEPFVEGDAINHATMNTVFTDLAAGVNALEGEDVQRNGLNHEHLPSLAENGATEIFRNGYSAEAPSVGAAAAGDTYSNSLPYTGGPTLPYTYQTFSVAAPNAPHGPTAANDPEGGWRIVAEANVVADAASIDLGAPTAYDLDDENLRGILVRGGIEMINGEAAGIIGLYITKSAVVAIGFTDGLNARHVIERSVRFNNTVGSWKGDLVTSTVIRQADLDALGDGQIQEVFMVVARASRSNVLTGQTTDIVIRNYNITAIPLHAAELAL